MAEAGEVRVEETQRVLELRSTGRREHNVSHMRPAAAVDERHVRMAIVQVDRTLRELGLEVVVVREGRGTVGRALWE